MPHTPLRLLRNHLDRMGDTRPELTTMQRMREERIVAMSTGLFATFGPETISLPDLALALRYETRTLKKHFADIETLLFEILSRHLLAILRALSEIPNSQPDAEAARRARYIAFAYLPFGAYTNAHALLLKHRTFLPDEERETIENLHDQVGLILGGDCARETLDQLDDPNTAFARPEPPAAAVTPPASPDPQICAASPQRSIEPAAILPWPARHAGPASPATRIPERSAAEADGLTIPLAPPKARHPPLREWRG